MNEKEIQDLELEEILKEFGSDFHEENPQPEEDLPPEPPQPEELPQAEPVTGDTIRLDEIRKAVASAVPEAVAHLISDDTQVIPTLPEMEETEEPWDAGLEEALEYCAPITFRPKSRLQGLRAKLVAGPEKRFYEISEQGTGKLQAGILLNWLIFFVAAGSTVLYALNWVPTERLRLLVFVQLLCMLLAALVGCYRLLEGLGDLLRLRFTLNTLLAFTFMVCCVDGVLCLGDQRISCSAVFCLQMVLAQAGARQRRERELGQMDTLRRATELDALVKSEDYYEGRPGCLTVAGEPESFMEHYAASPAPEKMLHWYALGSLVVSLGLGLWAGLQGGLAAGAQASAGALLLGMPATAFVAISRPEALLQKRLNKLGTVLCGWQGIRALKQKAVYPLDQEALMPKANVKLNGVKYFGTFSPDTVVCFAASLTAENGGCLDGIFRQLLAGRNGELRPVLDYGCFTGGVSGVIDGCPVSLGTPEFTRSLGVELPEGTRVPQAVCLCIDGQLAGLFAVSCSRSKSAAAGLRILCGSRKLEPVLVSEDFLLTQDFLAQYFRGNGAKITRPAPELRRELRQKQAPEDAPVIALMTKPGLAQRAYALSGARVLRRVWWWGAAIHLLGGALGLVVAGLLLYSGAVHLLTPVNLLLYGLIWMVPGWLMTQWVRFL